MKAWLITEEMYGEGVEIKILRVVSILSSRMYPSTVKDYLVRLEKDVMNYSLKYRMNVARNWKKYSIYGVESWENGFKIGHDVWLLARIVDNVRVEVDGKGEEKLLWDEIPKKSIEERRRELGIYE